MKTELRCVAVGLTLQTGFVVTATLRKNNVTHGLAHGEAYISKGGRDMNKVYIVMGGCVGDEHIYSIWDKQLEPWLEEWEVK